MRKLLLNLQTFDDGASAGTSAGEGTTAENTQGVATPTVKGRKGNNLQNVVYGKQDASDDYSAQTKLPGAEKTVTTKETEERSVQFENMIKGDYKESCTEDCTGTYRRYQGIAGTKCKDAANHRYDVQKVWCRCK